MRILLTGYDGYIGAVMVPMLLAEGHELVGLDTRYFADCTFTPAKAEISVIKRDIRDVRRADLRGIEAVIHLAALSNDTLGDLSPAVTHDVNYDASVHLAQLAREAGCRRYIFASSCSVYGAASEDDLLDEAASILPATPYARSKVMVEDKVAGLATDDFSPVFMRNATVYGVSPKLRMDLVVNNLVGWAVVTGKVRLKSDGTPWRPLVHVKDVCQAFARAVNADRELIHRQAFNVGVSGENYRIATLAGMIESEVAGSELAYAEVSEGDQRCYRVDFSKIMRLFPEYKPAWTLRLGIQELRDTFLEYGLGHEELEGQRYLRIKTILSLLEDGRLDADLRWAE